MTVEQVREAAWFATRTLRFLLAVAAWLLLSTAPLKFTLDVGHPVGIALSVTWMVWSVTFGTVLMIEGDYP